MNNKILAVLVSVLIAGCVAQPPVTSEEASVKEIIGIDESYLFGEQPQADVGDTQLLSALTRPTDTVKNKTSKMELLQPFEKSYETSDFESVDEANFSDTAEVMVSVDGMSIADFIHYTFGEVLGVSYVLDPGLTGVVSDDSGVTLNFKDKLSKQKLFELSKRVLGERQVVISSVDGVYFMKRVSASVGDALEVGVGNRPSDVPATGMRVLQIVPLDFGVKIFLPQLLQEVITAKVTPNYQNNVITIEGDRAEVLRAMELIDMFDIPSAKGRYVGIVDMTYAEAPGAADDVARLLNSEGVDAGVNTGDADSLSLLPLQSMGAVAIFATTEAQLRRATYWFKVIDKPSAKPDEAGPLLADVFIFKARYSQASKLVESIGVLYGGSGGSGDVTASGSTDSSTGQAPAPGRSQGLDLDGLKIVVNERGNSLIISSTGERYERLLPILKVLDVPPRQIMLDMLIAEVSLKDEFKHGVEWAVQRGEVSLSTQGAWGATGFGGLGMTITGSEGPLSANFIGSNSLVKVLSNPTVMVMNGESVSFTVGSSVSVIGQTTQDPLAGERQTTSSSYRDTGLDVTVTPTITAGNIVQMQVTESISNTLPGTTGASGNPDIFTRSLDTKVMAASGQTILLAGLISENNSVGGSGAPGLSKIPLLGNLFKSKSKSTDRSELIMLITPKVLRNTSDWERVKGAFESQLKVFEDASKSQ